MNDAKHNDIKGEETFPNAFKHLNQVKCIAGQEQLKLWISKLPNSIKFL